MSLLLDALRRLRELSPAVIEQALISSATFAATAILVRVLSPEAFVTYGVVTSAIFICGALQNALIVSPLATVAHQDGLFRNERSARASLVALNGLFTTVASLALAGATWTATKNLWDAAGGFGMTSTYLLRQYVRGERFADLETMSNVTGSAAHLVLASTGLVLLLALDRVGLAPVLWVLTVAQLGATLVNSRGRKAAACERERVDWPGLLRLLPLQGWSLLGALAAHAVTDGTVWICAWVLPQDVAAVVVGSRLLVQPLDMGLLAFGNMMRPRWAKQLLSADDMTSELRRQLLGYLGLVGGGTLAWFGLVLLALPLVQQHVFTEYPPALVLVVTQFRALAFLPTALRKVIGTAMQAKNQYRILSLTQLLTGSVALGIAGIAGKIFGAAGILGTVGLSEAAGAAMLWLRWQRPQRTVELRKTAEVVAQ